MKKLFCLLLMASNLLLAQNNVAFLHIESRFPTPELKTGTAFSEFNFELAGGMVIVKAVLNNREGNFILDTGAPGIIVNSRCDELETRQTAAGVNGTLSVGEVNIEDFQWGIIHEENIKGYMLDVSHLELACGRNILGLIGFDVLKNYELFFDYRSKKVQMFKAGDADFTHSLRPVKSIPFTLFGHVPVITAKIGGKRVRLGLDSGAEINLLDEKFFSGFDNSLLSDVEEGFLTGLDQNSRNVIAADIRSTVIKNDTLAEMRYVFTDLSLLRQQFGAPVDGLLGFPFFKNQVISINYKKKRIYIWQ